MGLGIQRRGLLIVLVALALVAFPDAPAEAAQPTLYQLPAATHAGGLTSAPDGTLWFAGSHGSAYAGGEGIFVGHWDPIGGLAELSLPSGRYIGRPAVGPGGEVWLPDSVANRRGYLVGRLGRLSASGELYDYTLGNRVGRVRSVAAAGGAVWFTASHYVNGRAWTTIGRIDAVGDGSVRRFPLRSRCQAAAIVAVANAVWFTESCWRSYSNRSGHRASIGRIDPAGKIARYPISARFEPISLAASPDGSIWFGESGAQGFHPRIGRVTPAGRVVEFNAPGAGWLDQIAVGPGDRLWFPSTIGGSVTRALNSIGPAGDVGERICLDPQCTLEPTGLTTGLDGTVWFSAARARSGGGGGGTAIWETQQIANEAGFVGRLSP